MKYIIAILIFTLIIMFHEWGHFLLAKRAGICVEEFCLGFGPTLISKQVGETKYSIKLLWFGGACMMKGEDSGDTEIVDENAVLSPDSFDEAVPEQKKREPVYEEDSFQAKSVWARMSVVLAGPIFNFILAFLMAMVLIAIAGYDEPIIAGTMEGSYAESVGLQDGDRIVKINGKHIHVRREASLYTYLHPQALDEEITFVVERDGQELTFRFMPTYVENEDGSGAYYLGISLYTYRVQANPAELVVYSLHEVGYWIDTTICSLKMLITGRVGTNELSGPVGIVKSIGDTYTETKSAGFLTVVANMLNIAILLSANLGVMNLLPIPALDGGRFLFLIVEAIRGKRIDPDKEGFVHMIGFALLFALMILILFNDIRNIIFGM